MYGCMISECLIGGQMIDGWVYVWMNDCERVIDGQMIHWWVKVWMNDWRMVIDGYMIDGWVNIMWRNDWWLDYQWVD